MKTLIVVLLCVAASFAQYSARYSREKLVGLYNLTAPVNCGLMKFKGPIQEAAIPEDSEATFVYFTVKTPKFDRDIQLDMSKLANADRTNFFHHILTPNRVVEVSGYACGSNGVVDPVSIRVINN